MAVQGVIKRHHMHDTVSWALANFSESYKAPKVDFFFFIKPRSGPIRSNFINGPCWGDHEPAWNNWIWQFCVILTGLLLINYFICQKVNVSLVLSTSPQRGDIRVSLSNGFRRLHYPGDCSRILVSSNYQCHSWHHRRRYRETWETPKCCCWGLGCLSLASSWISKLKE